MQKNVISSVERVAKPDKKVFFTVHFEDGGKATTFDAKIEQAGSGDTLKWEPVVSGKYTNIKDGFTVEKGSAPSTSANGKPTMTPEDWAKKDRIERASYEAQTAFKGVIELACSPNFDQWDKLSDVLGKALDWASKKLTPAPSLIEQVARMPGLVKDPPTETDKEFEKLGEEPTFKNVGEFLTKVTKELGISRTEVLVRLSINDVKEITNFEEAWATLTGKTIEPEDLPFAT